MQLMGNEKCVTKFSRYYHFFKFLIKFYSIYLLSIIFLYILKVNTDIQPSHMQFIGQNFNSDLQNYHGKS